MSRNTGSMLVILGFSVAYLIKLGLKKIKAMISILTRVRGTLMVETTESFQIAEES